MLPLMVLAGCLLLLIGLVLWRITYPPLYSKVKMFPGPPQVPVFGNALQLQTWDLSELFTRAWAWVFGYSSPICVKLGHDYRIVLYKAEHVETVLKSTVNTAKSSEYSLLEPWLGKGLLTSSGEKWHRRRKLLTPSFHFQILKDFVPIFNEQALVFARVLRELSKNGQTVDICPLSTLCALDIICETAMGKQINAQGEHSDYADALVQFAEIFIQRLIRPWLWPKTLMNMTQMGKDMKKSLKTLHDFSWKVILEREAEFLMQNEGEADSGELKGRRRAFLDLLLEMKLKGQLTYEDVREEVDTFMFEGHDTTAHGLMWTLFCLGHDPDVQDRLLDEQKGIFGDDSEAWTDADQVAQMKYLECAIKEALRLYPSVPIVARKVEQEFKIDSYTVPKGVTVNLAFIPLQRDPANFPDPHKFNPDRFLPENSVGRHPYAFVPFSAGPRNCIGQKYAMLEMKVVLSHLIRKFSFESLQTEAETRLALQLVLNPTNGILAKVTPRTL